MTADLIIELPEQSHTSAISRLTAAIVLIRLILRSSLFLGASSLPVWVPTAWPEREAPVFRHLSARRLGECLILEMADGVRRIDGAEPFRFGDDRVLPVLLRQLP